MCIQILQNFGPPGRFWLNHLEKQTNARTVRYLQVRNQHAGLPSVAPPHEYTHCLQVDTQRPWDPDEMIDNTLVYEFRAAVIAGDYHTLVLVPPKRFVPHSGSLSDEEHGSVNSQDD